MVALTIDPHSRLDTRSSARADLSSPFDHPQLSVFEMRRISHKKAPNSQEATYSVILCLFVAIVLYTDGALCVSPNALCSTTSSISCCQCTVFIVMLRFKSVGGEGHVRNVGPA